MSIRYINYWIELFAKPRSNSKLRNKTAGFTLIELLVSIILGSTIVLALMALVIELLTTDARETARTETQREMQMALDYISRDLREAVYVYDGACLAGEDVPGETEGASTKCGALFSRIQVPAKSVPVLAFWKLEDLPERVSCPATPDCLSGRSYTLVVYLLAQNDTNDPTWKGKARIQRFELPKYNSSGTATSGYTDPVNPEAGITFTNWPGSGGSVGVTITRENAPVLVDFLDDRPLNNSDIQEALGENDLNVACPTQYILTPQDTTLDRYGFSQMRNFYACIKVTDALKPAEPDTSTDVTTAFNQKVILFIRGNAAGKPGIKDANEGYMPAIATQVLNRGVFDKVPE
jgi:type II secretory pathway pseudopilin PulG